MEISLTQMLLARDRRAERQKELLEKYHKPLISVSMNIAGPVKQSPIIARGFELGMKDLGRLLAAEQIVCLHREEIREDTGCEALWVLDAAPQRLKELTVQLEEASRLGRLMDFDVLDERGSKLSRPQPRKCLICGQMAQVCARSRAHGLGAIQAATEEILNEAILADDCQWGAALAQQALLYEVAATPKPGLVDRADNGSHRDMDYFTFLRSTPALYDYFARCIRLGRETAKLPPEQTFARLRLPGKLAEGRMLEATGGVNTHKGAIFSLGIVCGALGRLDRADWSNSQRVLHLCGQMTATVLEDFDRPMDTAGQRLYLSHKITGIRGQAAAGYPAVGQLALPKLQAALRAGLGINEACCAVLVTLMAQTQDTNLIHRGGLDGQRRTAAMAKALLEREAFPGEASLRELNRRLVEENLSPGGCADLLAMTLLLHFLQQPS